MAVLGRREAMLSKRDLVYRQKRPTDTCGRREAMLGKRDLVYRQKRPTDTCGRREREREREKFIDNQIDD